MAEATENEGLAMSTPYRTRHRVDVNPPQNLDGNHFLKTGCHLDVLATANGYLWVLPIMDCSNLLVFADLMSGCHLTLTHR